MIQMEPLSYPLMEHFYTIQGEGANTGKPAYFLRLGGCDVGCVWCDVKDSWDPSSHPIVTISEMIRLIRESGAIRVVVTGGEPCMYDLLPLTNALKSLGIECYLETSGAYLITGEWDWICLSPKKFKAPLEQSLSKANELKVVVYNHHDFDWAEKNASLTSSSCRLFLQPEYSVFSKVVPQMVEYVKLYPEWSISIQTHKVMLIP